MSEINVIQKTQRLVVDMPTRTVSVILAGPIGPAGPEGEVSTAQLNAEESARIAGDALKVNKAGDTMSGNLVSEGGVILKSNTPFLDHWELDAGADSKRTRAIMINGEYRIQRLTDGGSVVTTPIIIMPDGELRINNAPKTLVPAISGALQAAQVTAFDNTTGRLAIGGHEIGDTGWRRVLRWTSGEVVEGIDTSSDYWTFIANGEFRMRRCGNLVHFVMPTGNVQVGNIVNPSQVLFTVAELGFRPDVNFSPPAFAMSGSRVFQLQITSSGQITRAGNVSGPPSGTYLPGFWSMSWPCFRTWPTSLPGIPV